MQEIGKTFKKFFLFLGIKSNFAMFLQLVGREIGGGKW